MTLWTLSTTPLHKIPPLIRAISLMAGGGAVLSLIWHSTTKKTSSGPFWVVGGAIFFTGWCNYFYRVVLLHLFTFVIDANYIVNIKRSNIREGLRWQEEDTRTSLQSDFIKPQHAHFAWKWILFLQYDRFFICLLTSKIPRHVSFRINVSISHQLRRNWVTDINVLREFHVFIDCRPFSETGGEVFHKISMKALCWTGGPKVLRTSVCREKAWGPFLEVANHQVVLCIGTLP